MKHILLLFVAATLGLSAPAIASARDHKGEVLRALLAGADKDERGDRDNGRRGPGESWRPSGGNNPAPKEISMSQAIQIVEQAAEKGHHLDGRREERGGRAVYRIQWATDKGERKDYVVDAQTGAILR
ncbi:hypothetical protein BH11PSE2_BH11PSE2_06360 [soil metagenome]